MSDLSTKDLPVSRLKPRWKSCMAVCQKLAKIRKHNVVDICMDQHTRRIIVNDFIENSRGMYKSVDLFAPKPCVASMDYITIEYDGVKMNLVWDAWFDKSREAAVKKGWPVRAIT